MPSDGRAREGMARSLGAATPNAFDGVNAPDADLQARALVHVAYVASPAMARTFAEALTRELAALYLPPDLLLVLPRRGPGSELSAESPHAELFRRAGARNVRALASHVDALREALDASLPADAKGALIVGPLAVASTLRAHLGVLVAPEPERARALAHAPWLAEVFSLHLMDARDSTARAVAKALAARAATHPSLVTTPSL